MWGQSTLDLASEAGDDFGRSVWGNTGRETIDRDRAEWESRIARSIAEANARDRYGDYNMYGGQRGVDDGKRTESRDPWGLGQINWPMNPFITGADGKLVPNPNYEFAHSGQGAPGWAKFLAALGGGAIGGAGAAKWAPKGVDALWDYFTSSKGTMGDWGLDSGVSEWPSMGGGGPRDERIPRGGLGGETGGPGGPSGPDPNATGGGGMYYPPPGGGGPRPGSGMPYSYGYGATPVGLTGPQMNGPMSGTGDMAMMLAALMQGGR